MWGGGCIVREFCEFNNGFEGLKAATEDIVANEECAAQEHVMMVRPLNDDVVIEDYQT